MSEAKYKVGQPVKRLCDGMTGTVIGVMTAYRVQWDGAAATNPVRGFDEELTPYDPPIKVGDAVRMKDDYADGGVVRHIEGDEVCFLSKNENRLYVTIATNLERDPDAGKAVGT